jgi:hypothetical protein
MDGFLQTIKALILAHEEVITLQYEPGVNDNTTMMMELEKSGCCDNVQATAIKNAVLRTPYGVVALGQECLAVWQPAPMPHRQSESYLSVLRI